MEQIFVFGSNLLGKHGMGAAREALKYYGAIYGQGSGLQGHSYAIPTKDKFLKPIRLEDIHSNISEFLDFADNNPQYLFVMTPIGTGLAGYSVQDIVDGIDFQSVPSNVLFTASWFKDI